MNNAEAHAEAAAAAFRDFEAQYSDARAASRVGSKRSGYDKS